MAEIGSAFISILPSARGFGSKLDSEIGPQVDASGKKRGIGFGKLFAAGAALGVGAKAFSFLGDSLAEATEAAKVTARTENVIAKMGNAANISADQVGKLAASLSLKAGMDDEAIQAGQNLLLTFGNIRNEAGKGNKIFNETSRLMVDMSAAMGTDTTSAARQLGKALNDPTKGVTALTRSGVSFTQQQKDQIKVLQESGDMLGAQKIILGEVEKQFGGAAASMATPAEKLGVAWGNLKEQVGTAILPMFERLATWATVTLIPALSGIGPAFSAIGSFFAPLVAKVQAFFSTFSGGTSGLSRLQETFRSVFAAIQSIVQSYVTIITALWRAFGGTLVTFVRSAFSAILQVIRGAFNVLKGIFNVIAGLLTGDWRRMWNGIKQIASGAWDVIAGIVRLGWAAIKALFSSAGVILKGIFSRLWDGIKQVASAAWEAIKGIVQRGWEKVKAATTAGISKVVETVKSLPGKILAALAGLGERLYAAGKALIGRLAAGVGEAMQAVIDKVKAGLDKIAGMLPGSPIKWGPLRSWNNGGAGKRLALMLASGIDAGRSDVAAASSRLAASVTDPSMALNVTGVRSAAPSPYMTDVGLQLQAMRRELVAGLAKVEQAAGVHAPKRTGLAVGKAVGEALDNIIRPAARG